MLTTTTSLAHGRTEHARVGRQHPPSAPISPGFLEGISPFSDPCPSVSVDPDIGELAAVAKAVHARGWTTADTPPAVQRPEDDLCVATLVLDAREAPAPALVWSERHGWRTAASRRHPLGKGAAWPPPGDGVCRLATGTTPDPTGLVNDLDSIR